MSFRGFSANQFGIFEIPGFSERMTAIRSEIRPGLVSLGEMLAPGLSELAGHALYPHVALHARRRVNPPPDTWVAFARSSRGYKAYAHFEVGLDATGAFVGLVLKDESADRVHLGKQLTAHPKKALTAFRSLREYRIDETQLPDASQLRTADISALGRYLLERKSASLHLVRHLPSSERALHRTESFTPLVMDLIRPLVPIYLLSIA